MLFRAKRLRKTHGGFKKNMTYKITASERTSASASEMETKAMLYLFCDDDEGKIHGFAIDFFNDVTGVDRNALHLYDIQSKGNDAGPADLGREMVTLFKNYVSEFKDYFVERILFVRRIRRSVINNKDLTKFQYADMDESAQQKLRKSLINSCKEKLMFQTMQSPIPILTLSSIKSI